MADGPSLDGLRIRPAARAVVLDPDGRILLVRFEFPNATRWALPGGGLEPGESPADAIRRELVEEVGLYDAEVGPHIWTRVHVVPFLDGRWDGQREQIHLVHAPQFEPAPAMTSAELAAEYVFEQRWWTHAEIVAATDRDDTVFVPRALGALLAELLAGTVPGRPVDIDV